MQMELLRLIKIASKVHITRLLCFLWDGILCCCLQYVLYLVNYGFPRSPDLVWLWPWGQKVKDEGHSLWNVGSMGWVFECHPCCVVAV